MTIWRWISNYLLNTLGLLAFPFICSKDLSAPLGWIYLSCFLVLIFSFVFYYIYLLIIKNCIFKYLPFKIMIIIYILCFLFAVIWSLKYHGGYLEFAFAWQLKQSIFYVPIFFITVYNIAILEGMTISIIIYKLIQFFIKKK